MVNLRLSLSCAMELNKSKRIMKAPSRSLSAIFRSIWSSTKMYQPRRMSVVDCFRTTRVHHIYRDSFHRAIFPILLIAQCLALMPVEGISGLNATSLHFKYSSIRTIYANLFAIFAFIILLFEIYRVNANDEATAKSLGIY